MSSRWISRCLETSVALVALLMLLIVAAILYPVFTTCRFGRPYESWSLSHMEQIGLGLMMYARDYDERLPPLWSTEVAKAAVGPYLGGRDAVWVHPKTKRPYAVNPAFSSKRWTDFKNVASETIVVYEPEADKQGRRSAAFLDGHAKYLNEELWQRYRKASKIPERVVTITAMREPLLPSPEERRAALTRLLAVVAVHLVLPGVLLIVFRSGLARLLWRLRDCLLVRART